MPPNCFKLIAHRSSAKARKTPIANDTAPATITPLSGEGKKKKSSIVAGNVQAHVRVLCVYELQHALTPAALAPGRIYDQMLRSDGPCALGVFGVLDSLLWMPAPLTLEDVAACKVCLAEK